MILSDEERAVVERLRAAGRRKRGTVKCCDCAGTGSVWPQLDCKTCRGAGELRRNGPEIRRRVTQLEKVKKDAIAAWNKQIKLVKEGPK